MLTLCCCYCAAPAVPEDPQSNPISNFSILIKTKVIPTKHHELPSIYYKLLLSSYPFCLFLCLFPGMGSLNTSPTSHRSLLQQVHPLINKISTRYRIVGCDNNDDTLGFVFMNECSNRSRYSANVNCVWNKRNSLVLPLLCRRAFTAKRIRTIISAVDMDCICPWPLQFILYSLIANICCCL